MENSEKIQALVAYMKELNINIKATNELTINGNNAFSKELVELREELNIVEQKLNKLTGSVELVNAEGKLKTSYKDYKSEEIYLMHNKQGLSWNDIARLIGCSKSTVIRKYKEYALGDMGDVANGFV